MHVRSRRAARMIIGGAALCLAMNSSVLAKSSTGTSKSSTGTSKSQKKTAQTAAPKAPVVKARLTPPPSRTSLARAAAVARAKRAAYERQQRQVVSPRFKLDSLGNKIPDVRAAAAIIYDPQTQDVLYEENSHEQRSIASLTKMMTAVTFVADDPDLTKHVEVTRADVTNASTTHLKAGDDLSLDDVLHLTLIASDNAAARILARTSEGGADAFVARMNDMATALGLTTTHYEDPSGLDARNVSSAYDLSHLIAFATSDPRLGPIMRTAEYTVHTGRREIAIHSTNRLLGTDMDVRGGKTGFISRAGYCLATLLQIPQGSQLAVVVLGAANSAVRFMETRHLFDWAAGRHTPTVLLGGAPAVADLR